MSNSKTPNHMFIGSHVTEKFDGKDGMMLNAISLGTMQGKVVNTQRTLSEININMNAISNKIPRESVNIDMNTNLNYDLSESTSSDLAANIEKKAMEMAITNVKILSNSSVEDSYSTSMEDDPMPFKSSFIDHEEYNGGIDEDEKVDYRIAGVQNDNIGLPKVSIVYIDELEAGANIQGVVDTLEDANNDILGSSLVDTAKY